MTAVDGPARQGRAYHLLQWFLSSPTKARTIDDTVQHFGWTRDAARSGLDSLTVNDFLIKEGPRSRRTYRLKEKLTTRGVATTVPSSNPTTPPPVVVAKAAPVLVIDDLSGIQAELIRQKACATRDEDIIAVLEMLFPDGVPAAKMLQASAWIAATKALVA